jgi:hypothetical protein
MVQEDVQAGRASDGGVAGAFTVDEMGRSG